MALHEYLCEACQNRFEQLTSASEKDEARCPKCQGTKNRRLISRFAVGGRGDLRESTFHGCHDHDLHSADENHRLGRSIRDGSGEPGPSESAEHGDHPDHEGHGDSEAS